MLTQIKNVFIAPLLGLSYLLVLPAHADVQTDDKQSVTIIKPSKKMTKAKSAAIDTESFELGIYLGSISIEDFGTNQLSGISFVYHINPKFIASVSYATSDISKATFEDVIGSDFLSKDDRKFDITQIQAGYRLFHGRSFLNARHKYNSQLYLTAGIEDIQFAGESHTGLVIGSTYKVVATDWLTLDLNLKDHLFERDFLSDKKLTNNLEFSIGLNALF